MKNVLRIAFLFTLVFFISCQNESVQDSNDFNLEREKGKGKEKSECETAFAYFENACFIDDDDLNSNRWGWSIGPLSAPSEESYPIYAGAGQCNLQNGEQVGELLVNYAEDGTLSVQYSAYSGYAFFETHLYVGDEKYPRKNNGQYTVAPGQYGNSNSYDGGVSSDSYDFEDLEGEIYIIAHAVVCEAEEVCKIDAGTISPNDFDCVVFREDSLLTATPNGDAMVPAGYEVLYVLTTGNALGIVAVNDTPEFFIDNDGIYRIHTLVYDPNTLDLSFIEFEFTLAQEVIDLIAESGVCAALDAEGAYFKILFCEDVN